MSFGNLIKHLRVSAARTARFELNAFESGDGKAPTLILRHAGEGNSAYINAVLRSVNGERSGKAGGKVTAQLIREQREELIPLFAHHVITGWEFVYEDDGKPAECTPAKVEELLRLMCDTQPDGSTAGDVFDKLVAFARNPENFRGAQDADALGKG